ncbi:hypothetical protein HMI54_002889 [Coelomomyces lativittatus]|nr:hypothetical protein HMI54_002889 [Coelomomyces lativittatus]
MIHEEGNYLPQQNVFERLESKGINIPYDLRHCPYFIYYDFEIFMKPHDAIKDKRLQYIRTQELLSIRLIGSEEDDRVLIPVAQEEGLQYQRQKVMHPIPSRNITDHS